MQIAFLAQLLQKKNKNYVALRLKSNSYNFISVHN